MYILLQSLNVAAGAEADYREEYWLPRVELYPCIYDDDEDEHTNNDPTFSSKLCVSILLCL